MEKIFAVKPAYEVSINGKDVTADISAFVSSVEYSDKLEEESDDVQLVIDDVAGLWQSDWYPQAGDVLTLKMGYSGMEMLDCGLFEIDEIELTGQPDVMTVKAIAAGITKDIRTRKSRAFEKQTLQKIAQKIADDNGLKLTGDTSALGQIKLGRKTQSNESDLSFLANLAKKFGLIFSVRGEQLVFLNPYEFEKQEAIATFRRGDISKYSFKDKTSQVYAAATVAKRDIKSNSVKKWSVQPNDDPTKKGTFVVGGRIEDESQAKAATEGSLNNNNKDKLSGSFSTDGNPLLVAGVSVEMREFGAFSGKWIVKESRHSISESGYGTDVSLVKYIHPKEVEKNTGNVSGGDVDWKKALGYSGTQKGDDPVTGHRKGNIDPLTGLPMEGFM